MLCEPWPPTGIHALRRRNPAGEVRLPPIADHRLSLHLSSRTPTRCHESGLRFVYRRGHVDITPAHSVGGFEADEPSESIEVRLPAGLLGWVAERTGANPADAKFQVRYLVEEPRLTHLMLAIEAEQRAGCPGGPLFMDSLGIALATHLVAQPRSPSGPAEDFAGPPRIRRAMEYIESHLDGALSLDGIARAAGSSASGLQRGFRNALGVSVHQYVVRRRVEQARKLLADRVLPASEVALAAGFSHQSHMAYWMRRLLGVTPSQIGTPATPSRVSRT